MLAEFERERQEAIQRLTEGQSQADVARTYVSQATISRLGGSRAFEGASVAA